MEFEKDMQEFLNRFDKDFIEGTLDESIKYKSVYDSDKYNNLESKPSWAIPNIDYLAVVSFEELFSLDYRKIATNAIRYYLLEQKYIYAYNRILVL